MELKLSERLQMMADAVAEGAAAADIGTDHGYLPIWLACNKRYQPRASEESSGKYTELSAGFSF